MIKVGCCGFPVSRKKYYKELNVVEINQTFYQLPKLELAKKWRSDAVSDFEFTMKAWQLITHPPTSFTYRRLTEKIPEKKKDNYGFFKPTPEVFSALERTLEFADLLGTKIILFQSPASFSETDENVKNLNEFFAYKGYNNKFHFLWEPRGEWSKNTIKSICKKYGIIHCVDPMREISLYGKLNYFRLHGSYEAKRINYRYQYTEDDLKFVYSRCKKKLNYVMFNNITMFSDALKFKKLFLYK